MKRPNKAAALAVLEVVATESPEQLAWLCATLAVSPARAGLRKLAADCGVLDVDQIGGVLEKAAQDLYVLRSRYRSRWRHPRELVEAPNIDALHVLALARAWRSPAGSPARSAWLTISRRMTKAQILDRGPLEEPMSGSDPERWIRRWIGLPLSNQKTPPVAGGSL
ncbi:MAG: hypothetical protein GY719_04430 [bacterium]|nr:hypothetical protein [bacterium]